jgi:hypothetical protein
MEEGELRRMAESRRAHIRSLLSAWRAHLAASGRVHDKLNVSVYATWGGECVLRAIASGPHGGSTVLKGGTMFRVWDGLDARPTTDLDLQAIDASVPGGELRDWLLETLCSPGFTETTGLVCRREDLKVTAIKDGVLPDAWRIDGDVTLGPPLADSAVVRLCVEATWGAPPEAACERIDVTPLLPKDSPFGFLVTRPEWMAAEKLHSLVGRGAANTRIKDFYDLAVLLLPRPGLDPALLKGCLDHVFAVEFGGRDPWPADADGAVALTAAFADAAKSAEWEAKWWPGLSGRPWRPGEDATLGQACEAIAVRLESLGLLAPCPTSARASAYRRLVAAAERGDAMAAAAAMGTLFSRPVDGIRLRERLAAEDRLGGRPVGGYAEALSAAYSALGRAQGFQEVEAAAAAVGSPLAEAVAELSAAMSSRGFAREVAKPPAAPPIAERPEVPPERLADVPRKLSSGRLDWWLVGVATLAEAEAAGQAVGAVEVPPPPLGMDKAVRAWAGVARRQGFDADLAAVLERIAAGRGPAPGRWG